MSANLNLSRQDKITEINKILGGDYTKDLSRVLDLNLTEIYSRLYTLERNFQDGDEVVVLSFFGLKNSAYQDSLQLEENFMKVFGAIIHEHDNMNDNLIKETGLDEQFIQLVKYIICSSDLASYNPDTGGVNFSHLCEAVFYKLTEYQKKARQEYDK